MVDLMINLIVYGEVNVSFNGLWLI